MPPKRVAIYRCSNCGGQRFRSAVEVNTRQVLLRCLNCNYEEDTRGIVPEEYILELKNAAAENALQEMMDLHLGKAPKSL